MYNKKMFILVAAGLLALTTLIALVQVWGIPLKDFVAVIVAYALFGLIIVAYLMRFALIILGVLAVYRMLQERYYERMAL
jgi:hypothetical protein